MSEEKVSLITEQGEYGLGLVYLSEEEKEQLNKLFKKEQKEQLDRIKKD